MLYLFRIKVSGALPFPVDMLRYDQCIPDTETDSRLIERSFDPESPTLAIVLKSKHRALNWSPTYARWESRGWHVSVVTKERDAENGR